MFVNAICETTAHSILFTVSTYKIIYPVMSKYQVNIIIILLMVQIQKA